MDKLQAYNRFWNSFDIPAYDSLTVPDDAKTPYLTYETASDEFGATLYLTASLWYRGTDWADVTAKEKEIAESIGRGGTSVPYEGGALWIMKRSPWAQRMDDPDDDTIRRIVLQYAVEFED